MTNEQQQQQQQIIDPASGIRALCAEPWAILPERLEALRSTIRSGQPIAAIPAGVARAAGAIAVIPIRGIIHQRRSLIEELLEISLGSSTEAISAMVRRAAADPEVKAIVLDIDSPGGEVAGIAEAAEDVWRASARAGSGGKPIVAVANSLMASAAYWIGSQADELVASPSAIVGSIGVLTMHEDLTGMAEQMGVKVTLISAGKFKLVGHPLEPLTDETKALAQGLVDEQYAAFVAAVARGRGVSPAAVKGGFGEGFVVLAKEAVKLQMADRVATLRETLVRLGAPEADAAADRGTRRLSPAAELELERARAAVMR